MKNLTATICLTIAVLFRVTGYNYNYSTGI
jgi:hypothetical protein